jgi:aspartate aminotransferase
MMRKKFEERRDYIVDALNAIEGITCVKPKGAFYVFPNVSSCYGKEYNGRKINNSMDFAMVLLEEARVALVPGIAFGEDDFVRISFATDMDTIKKGMEALKEFVGALK